MWFLSKTILFLIFFFLFFLFPASSHAETIIKGVTVIGNQAWSDTGINLVAGNSDVFIKFGTSPGRIYYTYYTTNPVSPEGLPGCIAGPTFVLPGATCYSLIARIDNGEAFQVQPIIPGFLESTANFKTSATGPLYFGFNDEVLHFSDNVGRWGFTVIVNNFPTPTPTPTPIPTPAPTKTPLILIPGIG
ncbi:hypothetical protein HYT17_02420, partial [Candidatus Microgenomates bacterium]|nr:hypothetical protein [Candidatus Microgenomates bacterium]